MLNSTAVKAKAYIFDLANHDKAVATYETEFTADAYSPLKTELPWQSDATKFVVCDICYDGGTDRCFYKKGDLKLESNDKFVVASRDENSITITASGYVHAVELDGEYIFSDNYFTMLNGETRTISFEKCENAVSDRVEVSAYTI